MNKDDVSKWLENIQEKVTVCSLDSTFEDECRAIAIYKAIQEHEALNRIVQIIDKDWRHEEPFNHDWAMGLKHSLKIIKEYLDSIYPETFSKTTVPAEPERTENEYEYTTVRSYGPCSVGTNKELVEKFKEGFEFVRASEYVEGEDSKAGYIEYILRRKNK